MPDPAEVRRQRMAYKQQVHELRLQYAKELQMKENKLLEARQAAASATARGLTAPYICCRHCGCFCRMASAAPAPTTGTGTVGHRFAPPSFVALVALHGTTRYRYRSFAGGSN